MPEYKTSPALHLQRTKLERAKMGDILKSKISHRPERTELVHRHILEDVRPDVDPSLCDRYWAVVFGFARKPVNCKQLCLGSGS